MNRAYGLAKEQLEDIAAASDGTVQIESASPCKSQFEISIGFDGHARVEGGLPVRAREIFQLVVPHAFPYVHPRVCTRHRRFVGFPHVQWGHVLCLYASATDWRPEDGMFGLISQIDKWIRDAARNLLDPDDAPLHPPVVYPINCRLVIPKIDTPQVAHSPWVGFAKLRLRNDRTEIVGWTQQPCDNTDNHALAILLHKPFPFEYPKTVNDLFSELKTQGIEYGSLMLCLASLANKSSSGTSLTVVIGTPMRRIESGGPFIQHLAVWEISELDKSKIATLDFPQVAENAILQKSAMETAVKWAMSAKVDWCRVYEMRPEVTRRRDHRSSMAWFHGRRVAIWGCGAIGTHVAESVVRAGVAFFHLVDNGIVNPGILVRQCFDDADIGKWKVDALSERLKRINPDISVETSVRNLNECLNDSNILETHGIDLVIDCTASPAVQMTLEQRLRKTNSRPPIAALAIDRNASTGMVTISRPNHSGGTLDIVRKLKLQACRDDKLTKILDGFWPAFGLKEPFYPEPGCSEATFVGSHADLASLSARMLNAVARSLSKPDEHTALGWFIEESGPIHDFAWRPDYSTEDQSARYTVKVSRKAVREMRAWTMRSARVSSPSVETGGLIFGEINDAASVVWITDVDGPPPDSNASDGHFTCGIQETIESTETRHRRYRGSMECLGSWHTHPTTAPKPSSTDLAAVNRIFKGTNASRRTLVLLILSGKMNGTPRLGVHLFRTDLQRPRVRIARDVSEAISIELEPVGSRNVGLSLSGGGCRAIAFHLGCFRALYDLGLLDRLQVISSVSGGSVIAAMYAYSDESFFDFDGRVVELLRRGLFRDIVRETLKPRAIWNAVRTQGMRNAIFCIRSFCLALSSNFKVHTEPHRYRVPPIRAHSRSEAFRAVLRNQLFGDVVMRDVARESLDVVINATELRTGSAFRFGSRHSGCWRFGDIPQDRAFVADAVSASAAFPVFLPALDREYCFMNGKTTTDTTRVLLSDGGIFDNLGVSPMEPGRRASISTNVFKPDYIICCDAGTGLFDKRSYSTYWPSRMCRSFMTVHRKAQDATRARLHQFADSGTISGFVLSYLGQRDRKLPRIPPGLPSRLDVRKYPTNFAAMTSPNIDKIALRGELLTRFLVSYYLGDL